MNTPFSRRLVLSLFQCCLASWSFADTKVRLTLADGSVIAGTTALEKISFKSSVATLELKVSEITKLGQGYVELGSESRLKGEVLTQKIPVKMAGQVLQIDSAQIQSAEFGEPRTPTVVAGPAAARSGSPSNAQVPSEADVERILSARIKNQSEGVIALISFRKTDGQSANFLGVPMYTMQFEAKIRFSAECVWLKQSIGQLHFGVRTRPPRPTRTADNRLEYEAFENEIWRAAPASQAREGTIYTVNGRALLEKTELMWRLTQLNHEHDSRDTASEAGGVAKTEAPKPAVIHPGDALPRIESPKSTPDNLGQAPGAREFGKADLVRLLATPIGQASPPDLPFKSADGKISGTHVADFKLYPADLVLAMGGQFPNAKNPKLPDAMTVSCKKTHGLNPNPSLDVVTKIEMDSVRKWDPTVVITEAVRTRLVGADARLFAATVTLKDGTVQRRFYTMAVAQQHVVRAFLNAAPENVSERWTAYKLMCDSLVLTAK